MRPSKRQQGMVLVVVIFFVALLIASVATFLRRALVDATIVHNRERVARAEALARGGIRLAEALLIEDRRLEGVDQFRRETLDDVWAQADALQLPLGEDEELSVRVEDSGARLNLNALFVDGEAAPLAELLLTEVLRKVIAEMPVRPEQKNFDPVDLARNLIDWVDKDEVRGVRGGDEDAYYQKQRPAYRAPDRPLLSLEELRLIEGFNGLLVEALRPYAGVYPLVPAEGSGGINPNTAPPWVLTLLFQADPVGGDERLLSENDVRYLLKDRDEAMLCPEAVNHPECRTLLEVLNEEPRLYPPITFSTEVFYVVSEARVGDVRRRIETVIDRGLPSQMVRLSWRTG